MKPALRVGVEPGLPSDYVARWQAQLTELFDVRLAQLEHHESGDQWAVQLGRDGVLLACGDRRLVVDTRSIARRIKAGNAQALARACDSRRRPRVLDGLAGWGTDGLTLAGLGCTVTMVERDPRICALAFAVTQAMGFGDRVHWHCADLHAFIDAAGSDAYDIVYLDPMFEPHPKTAKPSLRMQVLAEVAASVDVVGLAKMAFRVAENRVVVKRRTSQKLQWPIAPSWQIKSKSVGFDVFSTRQL